MLSRPYSAKIETTLKLVREGVTIFETDATVMVAYRYDADRDFFDWGIEAFRFEDWKHTWDDMARKWHGTLLRSTTVSSNAYMFALLEKMVDEEHIVAQLYERQVSEHGYPKSDDAEHAADYRAAVI